MLVTRSAQSIEICLCASNILILFGLPVFSVIGTGNALYWETSVSGLEKKNNIAEGGKSRFQMIVRVPPGMVDQ